MSSRFTVLVPIYFSLCRNLKEYCNFSSIKNPKPTFSLFVKIPNIGRFSKSVSNNMTNSIENRRMQ